MLCHTLMGVETPPIFPTTLKGSALGLKYGGRTSSRSNTLEDIEQVEFCQLVFESFSTSALWLVPWLMAEGEGSEVSSTLFTWAGVAVAVLSLVFSGALVQVCVRKWLSGHLEHIFPAFTQAHPSPSSSSRVLLRTSYSPTVPIRCKV